MAVTTAAAAVNTSVLTPSAATIFEATVQLIQLVQCLTGFSFVVFSFFFSFSSRGSREAAAFLPQSGMVLASHLLRMASPQILGPQQKLLIE